MNCAAKFNAANVDLVRLALGPTVTAAAIFKKRKMTIYGFAKLHTLR